jgi:hypothetical protein
MPINEGNETLMKLQEAMRQSIMTAIRSPEAMADHAVQTVLQNYAAPRPQNWEALRGVASRPGWVGEIGGKILKHQEDFTYGMKDAKREFGHQGRKVVKGSIRERSPGHWAIILDQPDPVTGKRNGIRSRAPNGRPD